MDRERIGRVVRRLSVFALTIAVVGLGLATVRVAEQWRAAAAPLAVAPVTLDAIQTDASGEASRAAELSGRIADLEAHIGTVHDAVAVAGTNVAGDTKGARALQAQLDQAAARLASLRQQLAAAQARLAQLNAAAARQAALNAAARAAAARIQPATGGSGGGGGEHEGGDDGH